MEPDLFPQLPLKPPDVIVGQVDLRHRIASALRDGRGTAFERTEVVNPLYTHWDDNSRQVHTGCGGEVHDDGELVCACGAKDVKRTVLVFQVPVDDDTPTVTCDDGGQHA